MKNTFWPHTGRVLVQGLLLLCLRLAQNRTGFDPVTGLSVRSVPGLALIACLLLCALAELILCRKLSGERGEFAAHCAPPERETLLLAAGSVLLAYAFSLLGGFLRKESSPRAFTFVADLAVLLCITALADANGLGELLLFAGCALVLASFLALRRETALDTPQAETGNP